MNSWKVAANAVFDTKFDLYPSRRFVLLFDRGNKSVHIAVKEIKTTWI